MAHPRAVAAVILAGFFWGTTGTVAYFIGGAVPALATGAVTMGVGGALLLVLAGKKAWRALTDPSIRVWIVLGGLGVVVYPLGFYTGMDLAGVAIGNILALGTGPLVGAALEWWIDRRRPGGGWFVAVGIGIVGVVTISLADHGATTAQPDQFGLGVIVAVIAGVGYGVYSYAMGRVIEAGHSPLASAGSVFGAGSLPLLIVAAMFWVPLADAGNAWWGLGYLVLGPMVLSYFLYSRALRVLSSSSVMTIALTEPAVATIMAVAVVGERFDLAGAAGLLLIAVSVVASAFTGTVRPTPDST
jgi:DME family drug/metabolite transporter